MASQNTTNPPLENKYLTMCLMPHILLSFTVVWSALLIPLYLLVLCTGFQRWRHNRRSPVSHTDFFTYHLFSFECIMFCGYCIFCNGSLRSDDLLIDHGGRLILLASPGTLWCHILTCIERYLAVVHPVLYLSLRKKKWIRARSLVGLVIWALCAFWWCILRLLNQYNIATLCSMATMIMIVMFCSVQVLRALRNPTPGEGRGAGRLKQKAFFTILAILFALMVWFIGGLVIFGIMDMILEQHEMCLLQNYGLWCQLPNSLVLPLLYLQRAGKLPKCRRQKIKNPHLELRE